MIRLVLVCFGLLLFSVCRAEMDNSSVTIAIQD